MSKTPMMQGKGQYINGQWIRGSGARLDSINPSYGAFFGKE